jgi:hypothetical protein
LHAHLGLEHISDAGGDRLVHRVAGAVSAARRRVWPKHLREG